MKNPSRLFTILALILSHAMCIIVAYNYSSMLCGTLHQGFSAPASTAFLYAIPFIIGIAVCIVLACVFYKKSKNNKK